MKGTGTVRCPRSDGGLPRAGIDDPLARFRPMGQLGAVNVAAQTFGGVGAGYPFRTGETLNLDASDVIMTGDSPSVRTATFLSAARLGWSRRLAG